MKHSLRNLVDKKLLKFAIVGTANTILGMGIMFGLYNFAGCSYWGSTAANYLITSIISFFANKYCTFQDRSKSALQVVRFALNIIICYLFAYSVAKPLVMGLMVRARHSMQENVAMMAGMCIFSSINYLGQRLYVFRQTGGS